MHKSQDQQQYSGNNNEHAPVYVVCPIVVRRVYTIGAVTTRGECGCDQCEDSTPIRMTRRSL